MNRLLRYIYFKYLCNTNSKYHDYLTLSFYRNTLRKKKTAKELLVVALVELVELEEVEQYLIVEKNQKLM